MDKIRGKAQHNRKGQDPNLLTFGANMKFYPNIKSINDNQKNRYATQ